MREFLVHAKTFKRIECALETYRDQLSPIIVDDEGDLKHPWGKSETDGLIVYGTQDAFFSRSAPVYFRTALSAPVLDWFQSSAAGIEHPMMQALGSKAKLFTRSHEQSDGIAEWVLWAGLDFFQGGPVRRAAQAAKNWTRLDFRELSQTRWLIIGFGAIGQATGRKLKALGAHVTGIRRSAGPSEAAHRLVTPDKFVRITVEGAQSSRSARIVAMHIANSPLIKTAMAAGDANWGRIVMAVGKSLEPVDPDALCIWFDEVQVAAKGGRAENYDEAAASAVFAKPEFAIRVALGAGSASATVWTCDLTHTYIDINGAYRT